MRRILFAVLAAVGLVATFGLTPATAATPSPTLAVTYAAFQSVTNTVSSCAVGVVNVDRHVAVPAAIALEATNDFRTGFHSILGGGYGLINAGGYPGNVLAQTVVRSGVYPPHQYDVWVPGLFGRPCTSWVHLVAQG